MGWKPSTAAATEGSTPVWPWPGDTDRLRLALASGPLPRAADCRLVLAVDITRWLPRFRLAVLDPLRAGARSQLVDRP